MMMRLYGALTTLFVFAVLVGWWLSGHLTLVWK